MTANPKEGKYGTPRCRTCGKFIQFADFAGDPPRAKIDFTPDTDFSSESVEWYHVACEA